MIFERIKKEITTGTVIPQPKSKCYEVKGFGRSFNQEALIYLIPNHNNPNNPDSKRIPKNDLEKACKCIIDEGKLTRQWFIENAKCASHGDCNFTAIGGVFCLLGITKYDENKGYYKK